MVTCDTVGSDFYISMERVLETCQLKYLCAAKRRSMHITSITIAAATRRGQENEYALNAFKFLTIANVRQSENF